MKRLIILFAFYNLNRHFLKGKNIAKRDDGARASAALVHLHQGPRPLDPNTPFLVLFRAPKENAPVLRFSAPVQRLEKSAGRFFVSCFAAHDLV